MQLGSDPKNHSLILSPLSFKPVSAIISRVYSRIPEPRSDQPAAATYIFISECVHLDDEVVVREGRVPMSWGRLSPFVHFYTCIVWKSKMHCIMYRNTNNGERIKNVFARLSIGCTSCRCKSNDCVQSLIYSLPRLYYLDSLLVLALAWFEQWLKQLEIDLEHSNFVVQTFVSVAAICRFRPSLSLRTTAGSTKSNRLDVLIKKRLERRLRSSIVKINMSVVLSDASEKVSLPLALNVASIASSTGPSVRDFFNQSQYGRYNF